MRTRPMRRKQMNIWLQNKLFISLEATKKGTIGKSGEIIGGNGLYKIRLGKVERS